MYCVKCGVELSDSERSCPLCSTPVYMPGLDESPERPYPKFEKPETVNPRGIYFIMTFVFLTAMVISLACDLNLNGRMEWSGYVIGGVALAYVVFVLPGWFRKYNPAIFVPVDFAAAALLLLYINYAVNGDWFLSFAFPLTGIVALISSAVSILCYYIRRGYLYIWGGAFILSGGFCILVEFLANITFKLHDTFRWSYYPLIALSMIGIMLIIIAIVKPFRESLCRIFAI